VIAKSVRARSGTRTFAVGIEYITEHSHQPVLAHDGGKFDGGVEYATAPQKAAWIKLRGVTSVETAAIEMEATATLAKRCKEPAYHLIVAYAKNEHPTREQVVNDAERLLAALRMENHQYVLSAHQDTDDFHAHVIANRVGPDGRANDLWHERIIRERVCADIAVERGWEIVVGHHNRDIVQRLNRLHAIPGDPARRIDDRSYRRLREQGELPWHDLARSYVLDAVDRAQSWDDLHRLLDTHGVVVKTVQRGGRVQGLAFAEGLESTAPGCAASRIDTRCRMSVLERRFGLFTPAQEREYGITSREQPRRIDAIEEQTASQHWSDEMRSAILAEVDAACSWVDLRERLGRHGVVVKLVERGGHVQGLAFAQGEQPDAQGCGASRIDPRCKRATLEKRFGSYPRDSKECVSKEERIRNGDEERAHAMPGETRNARKRKAARLEEVCERRRAAQRDVGSSRGHERLRDRVEHEARTGSERTVHQAERIVDYARTRSAYAEYRKRFFAERRQVGAARYGEVRERERVRQDVEAQQRRETRSLLRDVARVASRGPLRKIAYWSIDAVMARRRQQEFAAARARWEAAKAALLVERGQQREEKPMDYTSFVAQRAHAGDKSAQRVDADLTQPMRETVSASKEQAREPQRAADARTQVQTIDEVRARIDSIRAEESVRYERAKREREKLAPVGEPDIVLAELYERKEEIREEISMKTRFSDAENASLKRIAEEKKSWNPLTRAAAMRGEDALLAEQQQRYDEALRDAMQRFEENETPRIREQNKMDEQRFRQYAENAYKLEEVMNEAGSVIRQLIPALEREISVVEYAGITRIDGISENAKFGEISEAIGRCYQSIPDEQRRMVEQGIRRERKSLDRLRGFLSMDD
jgi:Relaxase/Mobilisation nuclease domain